MNIFFDLDGTLVDASERLYCLFCDLIPECTFTKEEYWDLKRNKINHQKILEKYFPQYNFSEFNFKWLSLIEDTKYLKLDQLYDFTIDLLESLTEDLYLITARQSKENLLKELESLNIKKYFNEIYVTENKLTKEDMFRNMKLDRNCILVTDTGKDIMMAQNANIKTIGVTWGFMNKKKLIEYKPNYLIDRQSKLKEILGGSKNE